MLKVFTHDSQLETAAEPAELNTLQKQASSVLVQLSRPLAQLQALAKQAGTAVDAGSAGPVADNNVDADAGPGPGETGVVVGPGGPAGALQTV